MAYQHIPLTPEELGPAAGKLVGANAPPPMKMMAARGLAPLPPRDLLVAMYHLWASNDAVAEEAAKGAAKLPPPVLNGALGDKDLHPGVLDFLSRKLVRDDVIIEKILRHPNVHDETLVGVARVCSEGICDLISENQSRWLKHPAIVVSLYNNRHCRMSVVHRMLEFAEREGVEIKLPMMDEIRIAMKDGPPADPERDALFKQAVGGGQGDAAAVETVEAARAEDDLDQILEGVVLEADEDLASPEDVEAIANKVASEAANGEGDEDGEEQAEDAPTEDVPATRERRLGQLIKMSPMEKIRAALLGDQYDRSILVRDSNKVVAMATIKSPKIKDNEAVAFSNNRALSHDVIRYIASRREWIKLYAIKLNLVMNPKTPLSRSMTLLTHLNRSDVRKVARSKNIPAALAKAAKRRQGGER